MFVVIVDDFALQSFDNIGRYSARTSVLFNNASFVACFVSEERHDLVEQIGNVQLAFDALRDRGLHIDVQSSELALGANCATFSVTVSHEHSIIVSRQDWLMVCWV